MIEFQKQDKYFALEKGTEETEKFVEHSLQQLRDLPMLTPLEPSIDINNELSLSLPFALPEKRHPCQGEFGHVFVENIPDYYRPNRRPPPKPVSSTIRMLNALRDLFYGFFFEHFSDEFFIIVGTTVSSVFNLT